MRKIKIKQNNGELRLVGMFDGCTLYCSRIGTKHLYRKLNAWGMDAEVIEQLYKAGLRNIVITDIESGKIYRASIEAFRKHGRKLHYRPHREQIFLALPYWEVGTNEGVGN